jgi:hypothetical protein
VAFHIMLFVLHAFSVPATIYGYGEMMCGDVTPVPCDSNSVTASGKQFNPDGVHVALHMPRNYKLPRNLKVCFLNSNGNKTYLTVTDKKGARGFDLSPAAVKKLGFVPSPHWSRKLESC